MKALVLTGTKQMEIKDVKRPEVKPNEVLVNTAYAAVVRIGLCMLVYRDPLTPCHRLFWGMRTPGLWRPLGTMSPTLKSATGSPSIRIFTVANVSIAGRIGQNSAITCRPSGSPVTEAWKKPSRPRLPLFTRFLKAFP